jgi:hypothetical protein
MHRHSLSAHQIDRLDRQARQMKREQNILLNEARRLIAQQHGWPNWEVLLRQRSETKQPFRFERTPEEMYAATLARAYLQPPTSRYAPAGVLVSHIGERFTSGLNAVEFAVDYVRLLLTVPRFYVSRKTSQAYLEMRTWLPYVVMPVVPTEGGATQCISLNRYYKPVGITEVNKWSDYSSRPEMLLNLYPGDLKEFSRSWRERPGYLFDDGVTPWENRKQATQYLELLEDLLRVVVKAETRSAVHSTS